MSEKIWVNPEVKKVTVIFAVSLVLISIANVIFIYAYFNRVNKDIISTNIAVIGNVVQIHPELKDDIVKAFVTGGGYDTMSKGYDAAERYGYNKGLPLAVDPVMVTHRRTIMLSVVVISIMAFSLYFFIVLGVLKNMYKRVRKTSAAVEKIVDGDFSVNLMDSREGDFAKLGHQFNEMAKRLKLTMEQLQNEKMFLKNIISDISHQLKTPLSSIKIFNEMLSDEIINITQTGIEFIQKTSVQIEKMEWLIKNLLVMARLEVGAVDFKMENTDLNRTVDGAVKSLSDKAENKGVKLILNKNKTGIMHVHDKRWLGEAIANIVKNSIEHTDDFGTVKIEIEQDRVMSTVKIEDNGQGIHKEDIPHVFERFYKGRNNLNSTGTGIGLSLAKSIIESHGGMIRLKSEQGKGTEFVIMLPKYII